VKGAYSLLIMTPEAIYAIRDPHGFRPLTLGRLDKSWVVASETCALDLMEASVERDVEPGEMVVISDDGLRSIRTSPARERLQCVFEYVYFARPDSVLWGRNVHTVRKAMGHQLAREYPMPADIVIPVPDSGTSAALGYSEESGVPYEMGLIRNHYVGIRHFGVKVKLNPMREMLDGKRVVVVDDSIVRGTTSRKIVKMIRGAGAKEVHVRISSPPIQWPCYYGIDTPTRKELIGSSHHVDEICRYLGADSLGYLSLEGMLKATGSAPANYCHACFTGAYKVGIEPDPTPQLRLFDV
jgi:amidophosphoribosyltransferase